MSKSSGIGVTGLLGVVFVTLKLTKIIDWSWWWVLAPFWVPVLCVALFAIWFIRKRSQRRKAKNDCIET